MKKIALFLGAGSISTDFIRNLNFEDYQIKFFSRTKISNFDTHIIDFCDIQSYASELTKFAPEIIYSSIWGHLNSNYKNSYLNSTYAKATIELYEMGISLGANHLFGIGTGDEHRKISFSEYSLAKQTVLDFLINHPLKVPFTWLRPFQVYGLGRESNNLFHQLIKAREKNSTLNVSNPFQSFYWTSSQDVAVAIQCCLDKKIYGFHDVSNASAYTVLDFCNIFRSTTNSNFEIQVNEKYTHPSVENIIPNFETELHQYWKAKDSLEEGIRRYCDD
jgi:nucleoside-diphosphate-sugar epimerase